MTFHWIDLHLSHPRICFKQRNWSGGSRAENENVEGFETDNAQEFIRKAQLTFCKNERTLGQPWLSQLTQKTEQLSGLLYGPYPVRPAVGRDTVTKLLPQGFF